MAENSEKQTRANIALRKGTKRPSDGKPWPVADLSKSRALKKAKGGHKQHEREVRSKKAGFYVHGHKNYGDVYEE